MHLLARARLNASVAMSLLARARLTASVAMGLLARALLEAGAMNWIARVRAGTVTARATEGVGRFSGAIRPSAVDRAGC